MARSGAFLKRSLIFVHRWVVVALSRGVVIGVWMLSPRKRYRSAGWKVAAIVRARFNSPNEDLVAEA